MRKWGGLDETFTISLNGRGFCLKIREKGYLNIFTPFAELYHYESKTGGWKKERSSAAMKGECEHFGKDGKHSWMQAIPTTIRIFHWIIRTLPCAFRGET